MVLDTHSSRFFSGGAASNTTQAQPKVSAKVANLERARPTADNIDEVDDVKQTQKEPNNIKKSQKQKNAEEVDRLCAIDSSKDEGLGLLQSHNQELLIYCTTGSSY